MYSYDVIEDVMFVSPLRACYDMHVVIWLYGYMVIWLYGYDL